MLFTEIVQIINAIAPIAKILIEWGIRGSKETTAKRLDISKAYHNYKTELKENHAILEHINLDAIVTKNIVEPGVKGIVSRLKTKAADALLLSLLSHIQNPQKAVKSLFVKPKKADAAEAKEIIKAIIFVFDKIKELQNFTTLTEAEQKILKGFYVRKRIKNIREKTLFIKQRL